MQSSVGHSLEMLALVDRRIQRREEGTVLEVLHSFAGEVHGNLVVAGDPRERRIGRVEGGHQTVPGAVEVRSFAVAAVDDIPAEVEDIAGAALVVVDRLDNLAAAGDMRLGEDIVDSALEEAADSNLVVVVRNLGEEELRAISTCLPEADVRYKRPKNQ